MATFKTIALTSIFVGDRARPVDEDHALAIAASMAERGLINPITVRSTPNAKKGETPYTLVAGGHRLRAAELNQWGEIDAIVVSADAVEAQLIELSENIFRNELSKLDRPLFVMKFREIIEEKHGKITRGGDQRAKGNDYPLQLPPGKELSRLVQERLGFGEETYKLVTRIGQNLHPELRAMLRGTEAENDQSQLLKLAKLPKDEQVKIAAALREEPDLKKVLALTKPASPIVLPVATPQSVILARLLSAWDEASEDTRSEFLRITGLSGETDPLMAEIQGEAA
ncbi:ParB family chromosome partitioning protein [Agrobacterium larrymoorei]|uniref:ParB family chromosome partitioning protein n=1 Tax=Agrobacterium larrymoorei TaxID=160699 RepID=A0AAJ2ESB9_9HYPH|nr:ParB N-terminal domain-containing protein [Agrobacterium larrymoorei]MDR6102759.1 ParB family chromosome partitioning protein [Agrobacterium larrymoorei]